MQNNLVANQNGVAQLTDSNLVNPWGMSFSSTSPFWVSNNGTGTTTLYNVTPANDTVTKGALTVTIPGAGNVTGQVFNGGSGFNSDRFLFVSEDGTVSGWRGALGTNAEVLQTGQSSNNYKGVTIDTTGGHDYLLAANFKTGAIDVLKGFSGDPNLTGNFLDPNLPAGYAPFNIQNIGGTIFVAYAQQDGTGDDEVAGAGKGFVNAFDGQGNLLGRVGTGGALNAPWGMALAPSTFGAFAGQLLVGNFGDGHISVYDVNTHNYLGQLQNDSGGTLAIDGLWALGAGNGGNGGSMDRLYFTAGPNGEADGLFGSLAPVPEPGSIVVLAGLGLAMLRRRQAAR